jgi:hypothetical protein
MLKKKNEKKYIKKKYLTPKIDIVPKILWMEIYLTTKTPQFSVLGN